MKLKVFSVFDSKAAYFGQPFFDQSENSAIRNFADAVNDSSNPNNMWNKHPEDFSLFNIGEFDNETGQIEKQLPLSVITASAIKSINQEKTFVVGSNKPTEEIVQ